MPSQPCSAKARWKSCGKPPSRSRASQYSSGKRAQIFSIAARIACCSAEKENSMAHLAPADHENVAVRHWSTASACGILENTGTTGDKTHADARRGGLAGRSEERRVGKECGASGA